MNEIKSSLIERLRTIPSDDYTAVRFEAAAMLEAKDKEIAEWRKKAEARYGVCQYCKGTL